MKKESIKSNESGDDDAGWNESANSEDFEESNEDDIDEMTLMRPL